MLALEGRAAPPGEDVYELPPFTVTESGGPRWHYARLPGFEILSQASSRKTQVLMDALYRGRMLSLPPALRPDPAVPTLVVFFDQPSVAGKIPTILQDDYIGSANSPHLHKSGIIKRTLPDREILCMNVHGFASDYLSTLRADMQTILNLRAPLPAWLPQALFAPYGVYREGINFRNAPYLNAYRAIWWATPQGGTPLLTPGKDLWRAGDPAAPDAGEQEMRRAATSALFARWALFAQEGKYHEAFWKFVLRCCAEPESEALFVECFGLTYDELAAELTRFLPTALGQDASRQIRGLPAPPRVRLRAATAAEIARVRGEWERSEARGLATRFPEIAAKYREQARRTLQAGHAAAPDDAEIVAALGLLEFQSGGMPEARRHLEAAARSDPLRPMAGIALAQLRLADILKGAGAATHRLSAAEFVSVVAPLERALARPPPQLRGYVFLAEVCRRSDAAPSPKILALLQAGQRQFPREPDLALRSANLCLQFGLSAEARAFIDRALPFSFGAPREQLQRLRDGIPAGDTGKD
jgi:hypothetical protein